MRKFLRANRFAVVMAGILTIAPFGCGTSPPGAGFTNEPRPESADEKPASRTDFPLSDTPAGTSDTSRLGDPGPDESNGPDVLGETDESSESVRATPPAILESGPSENPRR